MANYLPEPIVEEEILLRLPVKSLLRFRCVCKSWLSLISSSRFIYLHYQCSISNCTCNNQKIIFKSFRDFRSLDYNISPFGDDSAVKTLTFPIKGLYILGSYNGLVCLHSVSYEPMYIWNPITGDYKELPYLPIKKRHRWPYKYNAGFGYDAYTDDYKVFFCYWPKNHANAEIGVRTFVLYSLKTDCWNFVPGNQNIELSEERQLTFFNGAFHWISGYTKIMVFELAGNTFKEIVVPKAIGHSIKGLGILAGRLSCVVLNMLTLDRTIWSVGEYGVGVEESSTKLTTKNETYAQIGNKICNPLCLTAEGHVILLDDIRLWKFSPKTKTMFPKTIETNYYSQTVVYVETLFSPKGLTKNTSQLL